MGKFQLFGTIDKWKGDSMLHDSGDTVCEFTDGEQMTEIRVSGNVRVIFKGRIYKTPSRFPERLKELFRQGKAYTDPDTYIDDNNWYEVFVYSKSADGRSYTYIGGDVVDWDCTVTEEELETICKKWHNEYRQ